MQMMIIRLITAKQIEQARQIWHTMIEKHPEKILAAEI